MFKRIFWLALALVAGWIAWRWFRQRAAAFDNVAPQPRPFEPLPPVTQAPIRPAPVLPDERPAVPSTHPSVAPAAKDAADAEISQGAEVAAPAEDAHADAAAPESASVEAAAPDDALGAVVGYCVRCKTKRTISDAHEDTTESGRRAARGVCPVCGAKMFTFLPTD
jgi:Domain of unknown function (DUF5679)